MGGGRLNREGGLLTFVSLIRAKVRDIPYARAR